MNKKQQKEKKKNKAKRICNSNHQTIATTIAPFCVILCLYSTL